MTPDLVMVRSCWARLGAGIAGELAPATPDLERLILDTARCSSASAQLVTVAVTWLGRHASLVAEHRLKALVQRGEIDPDHLPRLGFLLDLAIGSSRQHDRRRNLHRTMRLCPPARVPGPFYDVARTSPEMIGRAERRASAVSKRWNLWMDPLEPKLDALRPIRWIADANPGLAMRADFRGDLRASLLLCLGESADGRLTISQLARLCGASRLAVVHALEELELGNHVMCDRVGRMRAYRVRTTSGPPRSEAA
jgi:hypothetical protein